MKKLQDLLLDLKHGTIETEHARIDIMDINSLSIRDEDRGGLPMICTGIELLPNNELAIFVSRKEGKEDADNSVLTGLAQAAVI